MARRFFIFWLTKQVPLSFYIPHEPPSQIYLLDQRRLENAGGKVIGGKSGKKGKPDSEGLHFSF